MQKLAKVSKSLLTFIKLIFFIPNTNWLANRYSNQHAFNTFTLSYLIIVEELLLSLLRRFLKNNLISFSTFLYQISM